VSLSLAGSSLRLKPGRPSTLLTSDNGAFASLESRWFADVRNSSDIPANGCIYSSKSFRSAVSNYERRDSLRNGWGCHASGTPSLKKRATPSPAQRLSADGWWARAPSQARDSACALPGDRPPPSTITASASSRSECVWPASGRIRASSSPTSPVPCSTPPTCVPLLAPKHPRRPRN
jgi:hypothetical protein